MLRNQLRLALTFAIAALLLVAALPASAQMPPVQPPDSTGGVFARVVTDKISYAPDEPIEIVVHAVNATPDSVTLEFGSSCHAAYSIDDAYHSIQHVGCLMVVTRVTLAPGQDLVLGRFTHTADAYRVGPGPHVITGEILGHARAQTRIVVQGPVSNSFALNGWVEPRLADVGDPVGFHLTVTNNGDSTAAFVVDGCPVHYTIDSEFTPHWACAEFARRITLAPGESISFGPDNDPQLLHDPALYPLGPGPHVVTLGIGGVGRVPVPFEVRALDPDVAALAGRILDERFPILDGVAILSFSTNDSILTPSTAPEFGVPIGGAGWFLFGNVPPGRYYLRVEVESLWDASGATNRRVVWYPGVNDPALAQPIDLFAGVYRDSVTIKLPGEEPPPPPPDLYSIDGSVFALSAIPEGTPLAGAAVIAVPMVYTFADSVPQPDVSGSIDGPLPLLPGRVIGFTGPEGRFHLEVPAGTYRLIAGKTGEYRYQYWNHAGRVAGATLIQVPDPAMDAAIPPQPIRFDLAPMDASASAAIAGTVLAMDPVTDGLPQPLADAEVTVVPILPDLTASRIGYRVLTDANGQYTLEVPPGSPYIVSVFKQGYGLQFFGGTFRADGTQWVDVAPGETTKGIDFTLQPTGGSGTDGAIEGWVYRGDVRCADGDARCLVPAAGAVVRVSAAYPTFAPYERRTIVGPDGHFYIDGLAAGDDGSLAYYVSAELDGSAPAYYPGGVPFDQAQPLSVFPGRPVDAGHIFVGRTVPPPADGFVFGILVDPLGAPIPGALVHVYTEPENPHGPVFTVMAGADGNFFVQGLPVGVPVLLSAEAEGFIPAYYPNVHHWKASQRVGTGGPAIDPAPLTMTLRRGLGGGPFIQAGRVRVAVDDSTGVVEDSTGVVEPGGGWAGDGVRLRIMAWHRENLRGAFFYLVNALSMSAVDIPVAGGSSGDNGTLVLTGLPMGVYTAYADRPGYNPAYFGMAAGGGPTMIRLNENTAAVLADIRLEPLGGATPPPNGGGDAGMVSYLGNAPNPFRPQTTIGYRLEQACPVTLRVFDYQGRLVRTLVTDEPNTVGLHEKVWDGRDDRGRRVSAGVYFYRIAAQNHETARRMVLLP